MFQGTKQLLARVLGVLVGIAIFTVALLFAWMLALMVGVIVLATWAYLSWRLRSLAKEAERRGEGPAVIEGEYRVEPEVTKSIERDSAKQGDAKRPRRRDP